MRCVTLSGSECAYTAARLYSANVLRRTNLEMIGYTDTLLG